MRAGSGTFRIPDRTLVVCFFVLFYRTFCRPLRPSLRSSLTRGHVGRVGGRGEFLSLNRFPVPFGSRWLFGSRRHAGVSSRLGEGSRTRESGVFVFHVEHPCSIIVESSICSTGPCFVA